MTRRQRLIGTAFEIVTPAVLIVLLTVWSVGASGFFFPPVPDILESVWTLWLAGPYRADVVASGLRALTGFGVATVLGIALGVALATLPRLARAVHPILEFLRAMPPPVLIPFALTLFGIADSGKVFIIVATAIWPILLNTTDGIRGADSLMLDTSRVYSIGGWRRIRHVLLPAAAPQILTGMRTATSVTIIVTIVSELVGSFDGIGYQLLRAQRVYGMVDMWSGVVILGLAGYLLNVLFTVLDHRLLSWFHGARESR